RGNASRPAPELMCPVTMSLPATGPTRERRRHQPEGSTFDPASARVGLPPIAPEGLAMSRRKLILTGTALGVVALLVVSTVAYVKGWWPSRIELLPNPAPVTVAPHSDSFSARNERYYLRPVPTGKPGPRPTAQQTWDGLFPGMAADPSTR